MIFALLATFLLDLHYSSFVLFGIVVYHLGQAWPEMTSVLLAFRARSGRTLKFLIVCMCACIYICICICVCICVCLPVCACRAPLGHTCQ